MTASVPPATGPFTAPLTDPDGFLTLDQIFIEGLVGETVIGIHDDELHAPQPVVIDVHAGVPRTRAADTDRIGDTIDYSVVRARLLRLMVEHRTQLLEAFAEEIARIVLHEFGARRVRVRVVKPRKFSDLDAVGVQIDRERHVEPDGHERVGAPVLRLIGAGMVVPRH